MRGVSYKGILHEVDDYGRLDLSGLDIEDLSEVEGLESIQHVKSLLLQNNQISRIKNLDNFTELEVLSLYNNQIPKIENLSSLKKLKILILTNNQISKIEGLENLTELTGLNLSENSIENIEGLEHLIKLETLLLDNNKIKELNGLEPLTNLRILDISCNKIENIKGLDVLVNIEKIELKNNALSEIKGLECLENLTYLSIDDDLIPDEISKQFEKREKNPTIIAQKLLEYYIKQKEEEELQKEKEQGMPKEDDSKKRFAQIKSDFEKFDVDWNEFVEKDMYLVYKTKSFFLKRLKNLSKLPWYYSLIHPQKLIRMKNRKEDIELEINMFNSTFVEKRLKEYSDFFDGKKFGKKYPLDHDQRIAVITDDKHNLIVAGAGSGKTSVLANRIAYLITRKDKIEKDRILALAYANVAAREMKKRLKKNYNLDIDISTFHALGLRIIKEEKDYKPKVISDTERASIIKKIFDDLFKNPGYQELVISFLSYCNEEELEEESYEDKELYFEYMRNKKYSTLNNIQVKSISEKDIGNFLFWHGISFQYEPLVEWVDKDEEGEKEYHPDFYLPDYDIYIEHWGLNREMKVPKWFSMTSTEYRKNREWKLSQFEKYEKILIETWEYERLEDILIANLKEKLTESNPSIEFVPLKYNDLVNETYEFEEKKGDIFDLINNFIQIAKSNYLMEDDIRGRLKMSNYSKRQRLFGQIALMVYEDYQVFMEKEKKIDFNDMLNRAMDLIRLNPKKYLEMYDHILIDEFQDISLQRMELIKNFVNSKSNTKLFCVGDDWQSIYQFTGSDVRYFVEFSQFFPHPEINYLTRNYRSAQNLVQMSNQFISHNKFQVQKEALSHASLKDKTIIHFRINDKLTEGDRINPYFIFSLSNKLIKEGAKPEDLMVISRFNFHLKKSRNICSANKIPIAEKGPRGNTKGMRFYSAHKSKGSESKHVIITDLTSGTYGFPCEIQDSSIFELAKHFISKGYIEEERRLFYVALTRAKQFLFLFSIDGNESIFLSEIKPFIHSISVNSEKFWDLTIEKFIPRFLNYNPKEVNEPLFCQDCGSFLIEREGKFGVFLSCSSYPKCSYTFTLPKDDSEKCPKCGRKLVERQSKHGKFLGCTGYPQCNHTVDLVNLVNLEKKEDIITCPDCDGRLVVKNGKYGKFVSCLAYPKCKYSLSTSNKKNSRIKCPRCGKMLVLRDGKYGLFLGCSKYPKCKYTFNI